MIKPREMRIVKTPVTVRRMSIGLSLSLLMTGMAFAAPLDDQITAFKNAPAQAETAVAGILETGLKEGRAALAFSTVKALISSCVKTALDYGPSVVPVNSTTGFSPKR